MGTGSAGANRKFPAQFWRRAVTSLNAGCRWRSQRSGCGGSHRARRRDDSQPQAKNCGFNQLNGREEFGGQSLRAIGRLQFEGERRICMAPNQWPVPHAVEVAAASLRHGLRYQFQVGRASAGPAAHCAAGAKPVRRTEEAGPSLHSTRLTAPAWTWRMNVRNGHRRDQSSRVGCSPLCWRPALRARAMRHPGWCP